MRFTPFILAAVSLVASVGAQRIDAQMFPPIFRSIGIEQHPGAQLPLDVQFRDQNGAVVRLGDYFHGKPVLLAPVYYTCTTLCPETLRGLVEGISSLSLRPGPDYEVVAFSINPDDRPADALKKLNECTMNYSGKHGGPGWHFLTGNSASIAAVTNAIGFRFHYDSQNRIYVHAAALMIATPQGRVSGYLSGVTFQPHDIQQGLVAASSEAVGAKTTAAPVLCYPFSPASGRHNGAVLLALRCGAALTLLILCGGLIFLWRADLRRFHPIAPRARP